MRSTCPVGQRNQADTDERIETSAGVSGPFRSLAHSDTTLSSEVDRRPRELSLEFLNFKVRTLRLQSAQRDRRRVTSRGRSLPVAAKGSPQSSHAQNNTEDLSAWANASSLLASGWSRALTSGLLAKKQLNRLLSGC